MHSTQISHRRSQNHILWETCGWIARFIYKGSESLGMHNKRVRAIFFLVLEAISIVLDQFGRSNWGFLLAAFLLSLLGFTITVYTNCTKKLHTSIVTRTEAERQLHAVEIVFSLVQLIVTFIHFVLAVFGFKSNNYSASVFPLVFAAIVIVLVFKQHEEAADSPQDRHMSHLHLGSSIAPSDSGVDQCGYALHNIESEGRGFKGTFKILKGDITQWFKDNLSDAIVSPANQFLLVGGGCDGAIHWAAGPKLKEACSKVPQIRPGVRCPVGEARITPGFELPAAHVIHTVGPFYDFDNRQALLRNAYKNCLSLAKENNIQYIAFPAISCGLHGYPLEEAATIALSTIKELGSDLIEVHFVLFLDDVYNVWLNKAKELFGA